MERDVTKPTARQPARLGDSLPTVKPGSDRRVTATSPKTLQQVSQQPALTIVEADAAEMTDDELEASLKALLRPLQAVKRDVYRDGQWDGYEVAGYELTGPVEPGQLEQARALIAAACVPLPRAEIGKELAKVAAVTVPSRRDVDAKAWASVLLDELQDFPGQTVRVALQRWRQREKFLPTLAEIRDECHEVGRRRLALREMKLEVIQ